MSKLKGPFAQTLVWVSAIFFILINSGCDSNSPTSQTADLSLSFKLATGNAKTSAVTVTEAKILIRELEMDLVDDDDDVGDDSTKSDDDAIDFDDDSDGFETEEMFVVNLDPASTVTTIVRGDIPVGSYDEIEIDIHKPEETEIIPDPEFRDSTSGNDRYSVIVRGTSDGVPFELKISQSMEQEIELNSPLIVDEFTGDVEIDVVVDVDSWFVDPAGAALDPASPDDLDNIVEAIKDSFEGYESDDDEDDDD